MLVLEPLNDHLGHLLQLQLQHDCDTPLRCFCSMTSRPPPPPMDVLALKEVTKVYKKPQRFVQKVILILLVPSRHFHPFTPGRIPLRDFALVAAADLSVELGRVRHLGNIQATLRKRTRYLGQPSSSSAPGVCVCWVRCAACDG